MRVAGKIVSILALLLCVLAVIFYTGAVLNLIVVLASGTAQGQSSAQIGRLLGTLLADLLFLALGIRLWRRLRSPS